MKKEDKSLPSLWVFSQREKEIKEKLKNYYNIGVEESAMMKTYKNPDEERCIPRGADAWAKP